MRAAVHDGIFSLLACKHACSTRMQAAILIYYGSVFLFVSCIHVHAASA